MVCHTGKWVNQVLEDMLAAYVFASEKLERFLVACVCILLTEAFNKSVVPIQAQLWGSASLSIFKRLLSVVGPFRDGPGPRHCYTTTKVAWARGGHA